MYQSSPLLAPAASSATRVLAFALGMSAGAAVALLLTPAAGREMRARIADLARGLDDAAVDPSERAWRAVAPMRRADDPLELDSPF